jgi:hypothetical protein
MEIFPLDAKISISAKNMMIFTADEKVALG